MEQKTLKFILKLPAVLLLIASFFGSIYAAINKISGITWSVPVTLFIIVVLYFIGEFMNNKKEAWGSNFKI